ncbi:hypothetical protein CS063_13250 [Sporanaerobium hydrogeniformans]|uniref:Uncharacterized protein n=1 Tax=Sporanaerobium hydrogeniformans TaxID=3072179 RepID=A0AC61D9K9_9FIRM|nr:hypothetical protein [Sporanaerobium hydrogeniformans]PHV69944.1 hypothetical protein CS063_13250 [Sporanaerobium hydrogeniformans]
MADNFKLPGSSYEELIKIIKAYSTGKEGQAQTLDAIAQSTGMDRTVVSRNNGFLVQMELLSEGSKKTPTAECFGLGRAYAHGIAEEIEKKWKGLIEHNEFLSRMLSAINIRNGMDRTGLINHILYSAGATSGAPKVGANTIIEIFKAANLVIEDDGKIKTIEQTISNERLNSDNNNCESENTQIPIVNATKIGSNTGNIINININIDVNVNEIEELSQKIKMLLKSINE